MRDIRFRAWDKYLKEMTNVYFLRWGVNGGMSNTNFIYMQYTGLKDKNGKEIYEGDIGTGVDRKGYPFSGVVFWKDGGFRIKTYDSKYGEPLFFFKEVIGNIYENKDLL